MSYLYLKTTTLPPKRKLPNKKKLMASLLLCLGLFFFGFAVFPIIKFQVLYSVNFSQLINPLSLKNYDTSQNILGVSTDYTQVSSWFSSDSDSDQIFSNNNVITYNLSIPKLKISNATVTFGSMDLKKSLIQYPQTALPGQLGNTVIFGHSVLPQFFNSKNYLTIFSTLYKLEKGDEILIDYDKVQYEYIIDEMFEVKPDNLSVLDQRYDQKIITLITCSPPGTYLRRLIIKASLSVK